MESIGNQRFIYKFGKFILDPQEKTLLAEGNPIRLSAKEFATLLLLVENNGRALSKDEMLRAVWQDTFVEEGNLAKYVSHLRKTLSTKGQKYIETLPKHGYRFSADISQIAHPAEEMILGKRTVKKLTVRVAEDFGEVGQFLPMARRKISNPALFAVLGVVVLAVAFGALYRNKTKASTKINSIAVLPLKPLANEENNKALGLGLTDALITKLGSLGTVVVRRTSEVAKFADVDALEIGRQLKTDAVLEGTIQQSEGHIRINARLLNVADGGQIWTEKFDQPATEIFALQDALSNKIAGTLAFELKKSQLERLDSRPTESAEAYDKYLHGRFYQSQRTEKGLTRSLEFYEQAIALDPKFAEPYAGIADANVTLYNYGLRRPEEVVPKVRENLNRALLLNPNLSDAHLTVAQLAFFYERDGKKAEQSYQKAIEIDPNNADAFLRYGHFLTALGRFDDALAKLAKARDLNPLSPIVQMDIALVYLSRRDYPAAIEQLKETVAENPDLPTPHWFLGASYEGSGAVEEALAEQLRAFQLEGNVELAGRLAAVKQTDGMQATYQTWFGEMLKLRKNNFVPALDIAFLAAILKDRDQTLEWLEKAEQEHEPVLWQIKYIARYDFVSDDKRFQDLLEKISFKDR